MSGSPFLFCESQEKSFEWIERDRVVGSYEW